MNIKLCMVFGIVLLVLTACAQSQGLDSPTLDQVDEKPDEELVFNWSDVSGASSYAINIAGKVSYYDPDKFTRPEVPVSFQIQTNARSDGREAIDSEISLQKEQIIGLVLASMRTQGIKSEKIPLLLLESAATVTAITPAGKNNKQSSQPSNLVAIPPLLHKSLRD